MEKEEDATMPETKEEEADAGQTIFPHSRRSFSIVSEELRVRM